MNNELKIKIEEILLEYGKMMFELTIEVKDSKFYLSIGDKKNENCGAIFDELSEWIYKDFIDFLMPRGVIEPFSGEIILENNEICFVIYFYGNYNDLNELDDESIDFTIDEKFFTNKLNIDLSLIGVSDYGEENLYLNFYKIKNTPIEHLDLFYNHYSNKILIELNHNQIEVLREIIEPKIQDIIPENHIDFDCNIIWEIESDNQYIYVGNYKSTPVKIKLNEIQTC
jgi:hypothetical protein